MAASAHISPESDLTGMVDFNFVTTRIATGAAISSPDDVSSLKAAGITHIIDCRGEFDDSALLASSGMAYLWNGVNDDGVTKPPSWFQKSIEFALPALAQPHNKVYAHCAAGHNRGPSTALALMLALGQTMQDAENDIRTARPVVTLAYKADAQNAIVALGYA